MKSAYTLVELAMVIAIISVLSAIAVPRYGASLSHYRADAAARRIIGDIAVAQSRAKMISQSQSISFNLVANTYQLPSMTGIDNQSAGYSVALTGAPYYAALRVALFGLSTSLTFDAYGNPNYGGLVTIQVGTEYRTIIVDSVSGRATLQ